MTSSLVHDLRALAESLAGNRSEDAALVLEAADALDTSKLVSPMPTPFEFSAGYVNPENESEMVVCVPLDQETYDFAHLINRWVLIKGFTQVVDGKIVALDSLHYVKRLQCPEKEQPWYPGEEIALIVDRPPEPAKQTPEDPVPKKGGGASGSQLLN